MRVMDRIPRLKKREIEELIQARKRLDVAYDSIGATNLNMRPMLMHELEEVARVIDGILGRSLAKIEQLTKAQGASAEEHGPEDPTDSEPEAAQGESNQREER